MSPIHIVLRHSKGTDGIRYTIIDEADEMVGSDWLNEMKKIMTGGGRILTNRISSSAKY